MLPKPDHNELNDSLKIKNPYPYQNLLIDY